MYTTLKIQHSTVHEKYIKAILYTLKTAGSFLTLFLVNYAPTKTRGQNYNPFYSQNNPFHGHFLTPFAVGA